MSALRRDLHDAGAGGGEATHGRHRIDYVLLEKNGFQWAWADLGMRDVTVCI